nr:MAG TPA: Mature oligodendrocyte transmembrane protein [Caudoviricetes sp.]
MYVLIGIFVLAFVLEQFDITGKNHRKGRKK